jgi:methionyl-tRNA formyltransferase
MKVILLRADNLRHRALASILQSSGFLSAEVVEAKSKSSSESQSELISKHFEAREQSETDFFGFHSQFASKFPSVLIDNNELNSSQVIEFVKRQEFDLAITFGVSILHNDLIQALQDKILGIHLGLSPYYRGSGTNFFPFVNSELGAVGYTLMHLNLGIDKGPIVHQGRAPIVLGDSIHTIGNRNMVQMFGDILRLIYENVDLKASGNYLTSNGKLYKRKDFTEKSLKQALDNLASGLIPQHLIDKKRMQEQFPIIEYQFQRLLQK